MELTSHVHPMDTWYWYIGESHNLEVVYGKEPLCHSNPHRKILPAKNSNLYYVSYWHSKISILRSDLIAIPRPLRKKGDLNGQEDDLSEISPDL